MPQEQPSQPEPEQRKKPGPHEKLHTLYPLTFQEALERAFRYKPAKQPKQKPSKKPTR